MVNHDDGNRHLRGSLVIGIPIGTFPQRRGSKLSRWRQALANQATTQAVIAVIGNSVAEGAYSNDVAVTNEASWRVNGWVAKLRDIYTALYGNPGEGFIPARNSSIWTLGGGASAPTGASSFGNFKDNFTLSTAHTVSITTPASNCDTARIYCWNQSGGAFRYSIDGGALVTSTPAPTGADTNYSVDIPLTAGSHTLLLQGPAALTAIISGVGFFNSAVKGVAVHRMGKSGKVLKDATNAFDALNASGLRSIRSQSTALGSDLIIIELSANNVTGGWSTYGLTPAQVATGFGLVVSQLTADGADVLLIGGPWRDPASYSIPYTQVEYDAAIQSIANANAHCAYLDVKQLQGSYALSAASGFYLSGDPIHPDSSGHITFAGYIYAALAAL